MLTLVVNTKVNPNVNQKMKHWFWVTDTANPYTTDPDERLGTDLKLLTSGRLSELIYPLNPGCKNPKKR